MQELKKARVRTAKPRDVGLFKKLWMQYLEEQTKQGGLVIPSLDNVEVFANIFKMYVDPDMPEEARFDGVVLFVGEVAVLMWGESGSAATTEMGKTAYAWGIYIVPDQRGNGLSDKLQQEARKRLKEMGFDSLYATVLDQNSHGLEALKRGFEDSLELVPERTYRANL